MKDGVGSRVERAEAPVSPRGSAPRPLDLRLGRGIVFEKAQGVGKGYEYGEEAYCELKDLGAIQIGFQPQSRAKRRGYFFIREIIFLTYLLRLHTELIA